ncbi:IclR family transcriptional regulator [Alicyclobacillus tolerans]|uniref:Transcriptional regulator, IclR family n=2 Tax=Alicyclobacillus tolerans TaxID=90970 RepID=A0A1M6P193_9BACL|nr:MULTISPECIES: IclR family transcriptional regulator [Alicyclobacillus]MDP9729146.1 DNA-binding IclR family transcriptional regulator [Alicyclobacillus tengchongensis]QRF22697.1 IclR family transcriptional regulator [Alicyclobacillus sp. TC]SHK01670.1 transcriptional regulator, IclR family [Alicyclobacillus montanus]
MDIWLEPDSSKDKTRTSQTLARGLRILDCFVTYGEELGVAELSNLLHLPRTVVARLVTTLAEHGYLAQNQENKKYRLGMSAYILGMHANREYSLRQMAWPSMQCLAASSGETVSLTMLDEERLVGICIASIDSPLPIKLTTRTGSVLPLHRGATRKILLAYASEAIKETVLTQLQEISQSSPDSVESLKKELLEIRRKGYAYSEEELDDGAFAVAAPILTEKGELLAGIGVAGPIYRKTEESLQRLISLILSSAREIEKRWTQPL